MLRQVSSNAEVRDEDFRLRDASERTNRSKAAEKRTDHLRRHLTRIGAHALGDDAVVAGADENSAALVERRESAVHGSKTLGQFLDAAEAANRLGQLIDAFARGSRGCRIKRWNRDDRHRSG